jgi:hypothetical protein
MSVLCRKWASAAPREIAHSDTVTLWPPRPPSCPYSWPRLKVHQGKGLNESGDNGDIARLDQSPVRADSRRRSWPRVKVHQTMGLNESGNNNNIAKELEMTGGVCLEDLSCLIPVRAPPMCHVFAKLTSSRKKQELSLPDDNLTDQAAAHVESHAAGLGPERLE